MDVGFLVWQLGGDKCLMLLIFYHQSDWIRKITKKTPGKRLCSLALLLVLTACSSSGDNDQPTDNPSDDDPVASPDCLGDIAADGTTYCVDLDTLTVDATRGDGTLEWSLVTLRQ